MLMADSSIGCRRRPISAKLKAEISRDLPVIPAIAITSHKLTVSTRPADRSDLFRSILAQCKEPQGVRESIYLSFGCVEIQ